MSKARKPYGTAEIAAIAIGMDTQDKQIHGTSIMGEKTSVITPPDRSQLHKTRESHYLHSSNYLEQSEQSSQANSSNYPEQSEQSPQSHSSNYLDQTEQLSQSQSSNYLEQSEQSLQSQSSNYLEQSEQSSQSNSSNYLEQSEQLSQSHSSSHLQHAHPPELPIYLKYSSHQPQSLNQLYEANLSNEIHQLDKLANKPATLKSHDLIREVASRFIDFAKQDSI